MLLEFEAFFLFPSLLHVHGVIEFLECTSLCLGAGMVIPHGLEHTTAPSSHENVLDFLVEEGKFHSTNRRAGTEPLPQIAVTELDADARQQAQP
jgi:hypothetical protein